MVANVMSSSISSARNKTRGPENGIASPVVSSIANHFSTVHRQSIDSDDDANSEVAEAPPNTILQSQAPDPAPNTPWEQVLAASRVGRNSRASSIFSTRTPLTVHSDDARSINIEAAGQTFRISRDGSRVTDTTGAPPPYPGPPLEDLAEDSEEEDGSSFFASRTSINTVRNETRDSATPTSSPSYSLPLRTHVPPESGESSPETRQTGFNIPKMLRSAIQTRWYGTSTSPSSSRHPDPITYDNPRSRNDLRRTQSESSGVPMLRPSQSHASWPVDSEQEEAMSSPFLDAERQMQDIHWDDAQMSLEDHDAGTAEVSRYYNRIMRDMDREHRKRLHERDTELSRLRELLNDKDIVYRQQLRERDHLIDGLNDKITYRDVTINELKKNAYNLENDLQMRIEKARNETEVYYTTLA